MLMAAVAAVVVACGSNTGGNDGGTGNDYAPPFVGTWSGTLTLTETAPSTGTPQSTPQSIIITEVMANTVSLNQTCPDLSSDRIRPHRAARLSGHNGVHLHHGCLHLQHPHRDAFRRGVVLGRYAHGRRLWRQCQLKPHLYEWPWDQEIVAAVGGWM